MERLRQLYFDTFGAYPEGIERLTGEGSNRIYYRIFHNCTTHTGGQSVIGVVGESQEENDAFIYLSRHFSEQQLPVPQILAVSADRMCYLQTDLGSRSLYEDLREGREAGGKYSHRETSLLKKTIAELPFVQVNGAKGLQWEYCYPVPEFNKESVFFDLNYFKYYFLKPSGVGFHEMKLEKDFQTFTHDLLSDKDFYFMYRDFQARNVMLDEQGNPYFIDFQGGRKGPFYYDVASFLWQASSRFPDNLRQELTAVYYESLSKLVEVPPYETFLSRLNLFVLFRTLQVLGAYGFRGYFEKKTYFINSIPLALDNLKALLSTTDIFPYPYLIDVLNKVITSFNHRKETKAEKIGATQPAIEDKGRLVVRVFSFSYRKGIPEDTTGNGGGYVFDCRSTHNPGRYDAYKNLTGLDAPVIDFLEKDGEILAFLESVYRLADFHVECYQRRGFTSLMFSFGCTGGQHRSVYAAQHLAEHLNSKYGVEVHLCHREQKLEKIFPARKR